jgi:hypothetical protein
MQTGVPKELSRIAQQVELGRKVPETSLRILEDWFALPPRLSSFSIFIAREISSTAAETDVEAIGLCASVRSLLMGHSEYQPHPPREEAHALYRRLCAFQSQYWEWRWIPVRVITHPQLLIIEQSLEVYLLHYMSPFRGYDLAKLYCQPYKPRSPWPQRLRRETYLENSSPPRIGNIVRYMRSIEAWEDFIF